MNDLNNVVLIGRLTRDCGSNDFAYSSSGTARANISIAVNRRKKEGEGWTDDVSFFDVVIWGRTAEGLRDYLVKGKQICVAGRMQQDRWKDQQGNSKSRIYIVAENVQLLGNSNKEDNGRSRAFWPEKNSVPASGTSPDGFEDVPF